MNEQSILLETKDGFAELTLNRPGSLNSFNTAMHEAMAAAMTTVENDKSIRALLLTGAGRGFCAGQDLSDRAVNDGSTPTDLGHTIDTYYNPLVRRIRRLEKPVVCAVNGVAAGAGANIALACDIVLAARSAKFIQAFCKIGLLPDSGGTWMLPRLVGPARAAALSLLGEALSAEDAADWGLIYRAVDDAALMDEARKLCAHFATQPTRGLSDIKKALMASWDNDFDTHLDLERDMQQQLGWSDDYREGVSAFLAKRKPNYRGE